MNYYSILNIKPKYKIKYMAIILILIFIFIFIINLKVYNTFKLKGIVNNNEIILNLPIKYSDTIITGKFLKINNQKYLYKVTNISSLKIDESTMVEYQTIQLKINKKLYQNQIVNITIFSEKAKLKKKLKEYI